MPKLDVKIRCFRALQHDTTKGGNSDNGFRELPEQVQQAGQLDAKAVMRRWGESKGFLSRRQWRTTSFSGSHKQKAQDIATRGSIIRAHFLRLGRQPGGLHEGGLLHGLAAEQHGAVNS